MAKKRKKVKRPRKPKRDCLGIQKSAQQVFCGLAVATFVLPGPRRPWPRRKKLTKCQAEVAEAGLKTAKGILDRDRAIMGPVLVEAHPDFKRARSSTVRALTALKKGDLESMESNVSKAIDFLQKGEMANQKACGRKR